MLTYSFPKEILEPLIPEPLELDLHDDKHAFVAVAFVQTKGLRPKGFPKILGRDFFLIGYRIFVRYRTVSSRKLRGLYILKSETAQPSMTRLGNLMTHYRYETVDIESSISDSEISIHSQNSRLDVSAKIPTDFTPELPSESIFPDWKKARQFAGPLPFTFSTLPDQKILIVEGVRESWKPKPVIIEKAEVGFFEDRNLEQGTLASGFFVENIPYSWKKGRTEKWA